MNRAAFAALAVVAAVGLLARSAAPVAACSCVSFTPEEAVSLAQVILVGEPVSLSQTPSRIVKERNLSHDIGARTKAQVRVERYLKGNGPDVVEVLGDTCVGGFGTESTGRQYLLLLRFDNQFAPIPTADGCLGSSAVAYPWGISLSEVEAITGPGDAPDDSLDQPRPPDVGGFPIVAAAALAITGPVAFLLIAAFVWPRRTGAP